MRFCFCNADVSCWSLLTLKSLVTLAQTPIPSAQDVCEFLRGFRLPGSLYLWLSPTSELLFFKLWHLRFSSFQPVLTQTLNSNPFFDIKNDNKTTPQTLTTTKAMIHKAGIVQHPLLKVWGTRSCCSRTNTLKWNCSSKSSGHSSKLLSWPLSALFSAPSLLETKEINLFHFLMRSNSSLSSPKPPSLAVEFFFFFFE